MNVMYLAASLVMPLAGSEWLSRMVVNEALRGRMPFRMVFMMRIVEQTSINEPCWPTPGRRSGSRCPQCASAVTWPSQNVPLRQAAAERRMSLTLWAVTAVVLIGLYSWCATIVTRRNRVGEALAGIDVQLTQRHALIPNVLAIAKRFMEHEHGLLEEIASVRVRASQSLGERNFTKVGDKFAAEGKLGGDLGKLFAIAESYPALKSDTPMIEAQRSYQEVETNIAAARRFYNSTVGDLRNVVQIFPGQLLAGFAGVGTLPPFFKASEESHAAINASSHL